MSEAKHTPLPWNSLPDLVKALEGMLVENDSEEADDACELCDGCGEVSATTTRSDRDQIGCPACIERARSRSARVALTAYRSAIAMSDGAKESVELLNEAEKLVAAFDGAMKSQKMNGNGADACLIVMANYGDLAVGLLRGLLQLRASPPAAPAGGEGEAVAYWVEHPKFGMELSLDPPNEDAERRGWVAKPLYLAAPAQSASGHDIEAAIERIISIRNGMTPDVEARAIVRRELAALAALKEMRN